jgi:eukaryotic-like serine/threonine-protein kinase
VTTASSSSYTGGHTGGHTGRPPDVPGYRTGRLLGFGGSGEVWSAEEESSGQQVALKILAVAEEDRARVHRECMLLRRIDHLHVVRLRAVVELDPDGLALVLDHAPGGSLAALVSARGPLDPGEVVTVLSPLATALAGLHSRGLIHGDVSPGNVLFAEDGRPLLSDLGVAALVGVDESWERSGTQGYTDPAVLAGLPPTPSADVFGLCAVGWLALTGRVPPPSATRPPLVALAPQTPPELAALLERGLDPLPSRRPDAATLAVEVFDAATAAPVRLVPTDPGAAAAEVVTHRLRRSISPSADDGARLSERPGRRRRRIWLAGVCAALMLGGGSVSAGFLQDEGDAGALDSTSAHPAANQERQVEPAGAATQATLSPPPVEADADVVKALAANDPLTAVPALAQLRATAFATGSAGPLELANAPGSSSLDTDRAVLLALVNEGLLLEGLTFDVRTAELLDRSGDSAVVEVGVVTNEHRRVRSSDGSVVDVRPATDPVTSQLTLLRVGGQWRVSAVG